MVWTSPMTFVTGAALTAAQLNAHLRDNLLETAPAKATTAGSYFVGTGTNSISERTVVSNFIGASDTTTSTSSSDLSGGPGPALTLNTNTFALTMVGGTLSNNTVNAACLMGFEVTGSTSIPLLSAASVRYTSATANAIMQASYVCTSILTAGTNTFTCKYLVSSGTGSFSNRRIIVMPF